MLTNYLSRTDTQSLDTRRPVQTPSQSLGNRVRLELNLATIALQSRRGESHLFDQKLAQPVCNFIPYQPEDLPPAVQWGLGRVIKRPMTQIARAGKDRTGLFGSITHRDDVVEGLTDKFIEIL